MTLLTLKRLGNRFVELTLRPFFIGLLKLQERQNACLPIALEPHAAFSSGVFWQCIALHPHPVRLVLSWFGLCIAPTTIPRQLVLRGFSAGSFSGAAAAIVASRFSLSFRMHVTLGGISMSDATFVQLCHLAALRFETAPHHHVCLVHFLADKLCRWRPTPMAEWLMTFVHVTQIVGHSQLDVHRATWIWTPFATCSPKRHSGRHRFLPPHILILGLSVSSGNFLCVWPAGCEVSVRSWTLVLHLITSIWMTTPLLTKFWPICLRSLIHQLLLQWIKSKNWCWIKWSLRWVLARPYAGLVK